MIFRIHMAYRRGADIKAAWHDHAPSDLAYLVVMAYRKPTGDIAITRFGYPAEEAALAQMVFATMCREPFAISVGLEDSKGARLLEWDRADG
jgi:hypothetical protein